MLWLQHHYHGSQWVKETLPNVTAGSLDQTRKATHACMPPALLTCRAQSSSPLLLSPSQAHPTTACIASVVPGLSVKHLLLHHCTSITTPHLFRHPVRPAPTALLLFQGNELHVQWDIMRVGKLTFLIKLLVIPIRAVLSCPNLHAFLPPYHLFSPLRGAVSTLALDTYFSEILKLLLSSPLLHLSLKPETLRAKRRDIAVRHI